MPQSDGKGKLKRFEFEYDGNVYTFNINPEEFTMDEPTRSTVTQTKAGAWIDQFGSGVKTIFMRGTTGRKGGVDKFKALRRQIRDAQEGTTAGKPIEKEMTFHNYTDDESFIVAVDPSGFKLMRSKQNPLLYMYELRLIVIRKAETPKVKTSSTISTETRSTKQAVKVSVTDMYGSRTGLTPVVVGQFVSDLQVLNNGQVPLASFETASQLSSTSPIALDVDPYVSVLSVEQKQRIDNQQEVYTYDAPMDNSLLDLVLYKLDKKLLPREIADGLKLVVLELSALTTFFSGHVVSSVQKVSKEDMKRFQNNIRWVCSKLEEQDGEAVYNTIEKLRELDKLVGQLTYIGSLYENDSETIIDGFRGDSID